MVYKGKAAMQPRGKDGRFMATGKAKMISIRITEKTEHELQQIRQMEPSLQTVTEIAAKAIEHYHATLMGWNGSEAWEDSI